MDNLPKPDEISTTTNFDRYGIDSVAAVTLSGGLAKWLGCELDLTLLYYYPTIGKIKRYTCRDNFLFGKFDDNDLIQEDLVT